MRFLAITVTLKIREDFSGFSGPLGLRTIQTEYLAAGTSGVMNQQNQCHVMSSMSQQDYLPVTVRL